MLAIVLNRRDFKEFDQIISLYTSERGKIEALAKGVKKIISKQSSHLEPFVLIEVKVIKGRELDHIAKISMVNIFKNIRNNLEKSLLANYAVRLVDKMVIIGENDKKIFGLTRSWLEYVDGVAEAEKSLLYSFMVKLLNCLGFAPELEKCVNCGLSRKNFVGFDIRNGGVHCRDCEKITIDKNYFFSLTSGEVNFFKVLLNGSWEETASHLANERILDVIVKFARFHCGQKIFSF